MKKTTTKRALKAFGQRVKELRKKEGMTQDQLAFECDMTRAMIARVETGAYGASFVTLLALAKGFDIPLKDLLDFEYKD